MQDKLRNILKAGDTLLFAKNPTNWFKRILYFLIQLFSGTQYYHVVKVSEWDKYFSVEFPEATTIGFNDRFQEQDKILVLRPVKILTNTEIEYMRKYWKDYFQGTMYDGGQLVTMMLEKLGVDEETAKQFDFGDDKVVCSVGAVILDRRCLGFDPVPDVPDNKVDPGMLERSKAYIKLAEIYPKKKVLNYL